MSHSTNHGFSLRFRHVPCRNHLRRNVGDTGDIAERNSRREIGRQIEGETPEVHFLWTGGVKQWANVERLTCDPFAPSLRICTPSLGSCAAGVGHCAASVARHRFPAFDPVAPLV